MNRATGRLVRRDGARGSSWFAQGRDPSGRQFMRKLGNVHEASGRPAAGFLTEKLAKDALANLLTDLRRGDYSLPERGDLTFGEAAAQWVEFLRNVKKRDPATISDYVASLNLRLLPVFGAVPLEKVTSRSINSHKEQLIGEGKLSARTITRDLAVMHGVFRRAIAINDLKMQNPASAERVERPSVKYSGEFQCYSREQLDVLCAHASRPLDAHLWQLAAWTGLRLGELLAARWIDVDFLDGILHVRRNWTSYTEKVPKSGKVRSVPLTADALAVLETEFKRGYLVDDLDLVLTEKGEHLSPTTVRKRYYAAQKRAALPRITFHSLRHSFGSFAIKVLDPLAVQTVMGHSSFSTTQRYLHHQPRREDAAKLQAAFSAAVPDELATI